MLDFTNDPELEALASTLRPIAERAAELGIEWLLIGAAARDLILRHARGFPAGRATNDVDIGVCVATWAEYENLKQRLVDRDSALAHPNVKHRLELPGRDVIDIVPFGGVEQDGKIEWPPRASPRLDVRGLREILAGAQDVWLPGRLVVRVPTIEGYVCLKLFA